MQVIQVEEGQSVGEALAQAGAPDELIGLVSAIMGEAPSSDPDVEDEDDVFEFDVDFELDFELSDEPVISDADKAEAVAQLGRIIEGMTIIVDQHAQLLKGLVG